MNRQPSKLDTLLERTARIEEQQTGLKENLERIEGKVDKQNGRVGRLERWRSYLTGGLFVLIALVGWAVKIIVEIWKAGG